MEGVLNMFVSSYEILMGREVDSPLNEEQWRNLCDLLPRINLIRFHYNKPMYVSSGYRPPSINARIGGAKRSAHLLCKAVDFKDTDGSLAQWCLDNIDFIKSCGLYMEHPDFTKGWVHLQTIPTINNPFIP